MPRRLVRTWLPSAVERALGRRLIWRAGRALYQRARGDVGNHLASNGERDVIARALSCASGDIVLIDVGANLGAWTLAALEEARKLGVEGRVVVHAFEPVGSTFDELVRRLQEHGGQVALINAAASDRVGQADMFVTGPGAGTNSLVAKAGDAKVERVATTTIDAYLDAERISHVQYLKCDAEGHDFRVIEGARGALRAGRVTALQFEYNHRWLAAHASLRDVFGLIEGLPYVLGKVRPGCVETYAEWHPELDRFFEANYVLIHHTAMSAFPLRQVMLDASNTFA